MGNPIFGDSGYVGTGIHSEAQLRAALFAARKNNSDTEAILVTIGADSLKFINLNAGAITRGQLVYAASGGADLAQADALGTARVVGLVEEESVATGVVADIRIGGPITFTTAEWDAVTGDSGGLTAGARYFLDPATLGFLTATAPTTVTQVVTDVLLALSSTTAIIDIARPILL